MDESTISAIALQSQDPLEALYRINPEIATIAYAHKGDILTPQILPFITRFRELQSEEKISFVRSLVEKHRIDTMGKVITHQSDNELEGIRIAEDSKTERTGMVQAGLTIRKRIETQGLIDLQKLEYAARVQMVRDHIDGQKYLSDNQLRAAYAEAEAYKQAIETSEKIRADTEMKLSSDRLEERVRIASIDFAKKMLEAEIHRNTNRASVIQQYIRSQTELCLAAFQAQAEAEDTNRKHHENIHRTIQAGIRAIRKSASSGKNDIRLTIDIFGDKIVLDYLAK
jgi:hypothetical protein